MADPWQILRSGRLPLAEAATASRPSTQELAASVRAALASHPTGRDTEALAAWLLAWRDHWPTTFATSFAADASRVAEWATRHVVDEGRFVKLRRIAIENLSSRI